MKKPIHKNQHGLTLVEVLAGVLLLSIIGTLATMILIQIFADDKTANDSLSLKQDTNLTVSSLQKQFYDENDAASLCFDTQGGRLTIDAANSSNGKYNPEDGCINNVDKNRSLTLNLTTSNEGGKTLEIETTFVKGNLTLTYNGPDDDPCIEDKTIQWQREKTLPCTGKNIHWYGDKTANCKAFEFDNLKVSEKVDELDDKEINVKNKAYFQKQVELKSSIVKIANGGCFKGQFDADKGSLVHVVNGNTVFRGQADFDKSFLKVGKDVTFVNQFDMDDGTLEIGRDGNFNGQVDIDNSIVTIIGDGNFQKQNEFDNSTLSINGNGNFYKQTDFDKTSVTIGKDARFDQQFDFDGDDNSRLHYLKISGKGTFGGQVEFEDGKLDIKLDALFKKQTDFKNASATLRNLAQFLEKTTLDHTNMSVGGNLEALTSNRFEIDKNSGLIVYQDAKFNKNLTRQGTLCVQRSIYGTSESKSQNCSYPVLQNN